MIGVAVDTNAYTAFRRGVPAAVELFSMADGLFLSTVVLGELRSGFASGSRSVVNERDLARFLASPRVAVLDVDERVTTVYAAVYLQLRTAGTPVPTNDLWIAASALTARVALFTYDAHFAQVDGLQVVTCWSEVIR